MKRYQSWEELERVLALAQQGDHESLDEIFFFLRVRFLALSRSRLAEEGAEEAEDIIQQTLMVVYDHFSQLDNLRKLLAFSNKVLRNKIGNVYQKRSRDRHRELDLKDEAEPRYYIDGELDAAELNQILREAIDNLAERYPRCYAILLGLYEGLSTDEIGIRLQISKSKLKVQTFRCRQTLRTLLAKEYGWRV
jgi:RNA polymerase sigma-70 factor (ECF subfamily)